jgi:magnesium protoporphyrin O-methyltransferase
MQQQIDVDGFPGEHAPASLFGRHDPTETSKNVCRYFETSGFSRWTAIYGEGGIPPIWRVIRDGHDLAMDRVIDWIQDDGSRTALDAGCGTGVLAMRLSDCGYAVDGFDVSAPMVSFARYNTKDRGRGIPPRFVVGDIAALDAAPRSYDLVCCLDVLFHYPFEEASVMLSRLAKLSNGKLVASFALRTMMNDFWMKVGTKFHSKNRMTKLFLFSYDEIEKLMAAAGYKITRSKRVKFFFYDSFVFEAVRVGA